MASKAKRRKWSGAEEEVAWRSRRFVPGVDFFRHCHPTGGARDVSYQVWTSSGIAILQVALATFRTRCGLLQALPSYRWRSRRFVPGVDFFRHCHPTGGARDVSYQVWTSSGIAILQVALATFRTRCGLLQALPSYRWRSRRFVPGVDFFRHCHPTGGARDVSYQVWTSSGIAILQG
ncbi:hypothetical protein ABVT39_015627 [Epinephelus coioides]